MKTSKLLDRLSGLIASPEDIGKDRLKKLRKVVKELKAKQDKLEKELKKECDAETRHRLERSIEVVRTQRKKGAEVYRTIKQARKEASAPSVATEGDAKINV